MSTPRQFYNVCGELSSSSVKITFDTLMQFGYFIKLLHDGLLTEDLFVPVDHNILLLLLEYAAYQSRFNSDFINILLPKKLLKLPTFDSLNLLHCLDLLRIINAHKVIIRGDIIVFKNQYPKHLSCINRFKHDRDFPNEYNTISVCGIDDIKISSNYKGNVTELSDENEFGNDNGIYFAKIANVDGFVKFKEFISRLNVHNEYVKICVVENFKINISWYDCCC